MQNIIHTSGVFGFVNQLGQADYYPNGGENQGDCSWIRSHSLAFVYFAESILTGGFIAESCASYDDYVAGKYDHNGNSEMGTLSIDKK
ncbi:hypothetical protein JTB14_018597 [Gonioctena quinquepunctata]|nr:hypothetical protein JTB14_018597 [Gonioctena quinquepunctata]